MFLYFQTSTRRLMEENFAPGFIDTHCHLDFLFSKLHYRKSFSDFQKESEDPFPRSFEGCVAVFCDPKTFHKKPWLGSFLEEKNVWGSFGCHPHFVDHYTRQVEKDMIDALDNDKVVAVGEIGLDYSGK